MADEIDQATENADSFRDSLVDTARRAARAIPEGEPGICSECLLYSKRLVEGECAPCRDKGLTPRQGMIFYE